ncbi:MAG TPA: oxygen-independent coproporphyrinogen III oxidase [Acidimicrobiia bacterium]|nr:oxygen-independent coproporphyrinogen III oxidase [Acidimicrobiia bacterium]
MITAELLAKHDRPGPRYTSYPTAVDFTDTFGPDEHADRLRAAARGRPNQALSLYVHLPFCKARCAFCACHVVVARNPRLVTGYLDRVIAEASLVASGLSGRRRVDQMHWGGGTPTAYEPSELKLLHGALEHCFDIAPNAELAVEVDPRVTTIEHIDTLAGLGFNRLSMGVQDLDPEVQALIGRHQTTEQTADLYAAARSAGFRSINLDLIHGLPGQTETTMRQTLDTVLDMRPDRLAVYPFAFVPWMRPHQRRIDETLIPDTLTRLHLFAQTRNALVDAGYRPIGMDHFALPSDDLAVADAAGTLGRTFMGYTPSASAEVVALGTSGISDIDGAYAQNHRRLASYLAAVDSGELPVERGHRLTADDLLRREVITAVMCRWSVDLGEVARRHGVEASTYFSNELTALSEAGGLVDEGLATVDGLQIRLTDQGRPFVRRLAQVFDAHTGRRSTDRPTFSRAL